MLTLGFIIDSSAQHSTDNVTSLELKQTTMSSDVSTLSTTVFEENSSDNLTVMSNLTLAEKSNSSKPFSQRSIAGKILLGTGIAIFAVICILYGTVSIG